MFFAFPEDAHWNDRAAGRRDRGIPRRCPGAAPPVPTPPAGAAHARAMHRGVLYPRTRFETIAERKLRRRLLTEDGNVEISGRDLH